MRSQTRRSSVKAIVLSPSPVRGCAAPGDGDFFLISPLENKIIVAYNIIIRGFSGRGRKTVFGNSLACFGGAGRLLSRRSQKACGRQQVPKFHFVKTSRQSLREPRKRMRDGNRTEMGEPRAPKGMQDESRKPVPATFCRLPRSAVRPEPAPRVSPARGMACKRTNGVCTRAGSIQSGKSPPKPCFSPLPAPAGTALRQESFVFAEGGSFLCGKRFCFYRGKTTAGTEKCFIQTVPPPVF